MHFRSQIELHLRLHTSPLNLTFRSYFCSIADLSKSTLQFSPQPHALLRSIRSSSPFCSYTPHQLASLSFPLRLHATSVSGPPEASFIHHFRSQGSPLLFIILHWVSGLNSASFCYISHPLSSRSLPHISSPPMILWQLHISLFITVFHSSSASFSIQLPYPLNFTSISFLLS